MATHRILNLLIRVVSMRVQSCGVYVCAECALYVCLNSFPEYF